MHQARIYLKNRTKAAALLIPVGFFLLGAGADTASSMSETTEKPEAPGPSVDVEVEINLDALEEEESAAASHGIVPEEPMLPVRVTEVELHRNPWLALIALITTVPVALMLLPPRRTNRRRTSASDENTRAKKEA